MLHRKVLIADDDPDIRRLVAHWLEAAGYEVQHAVDGRAALETAHRDCPYFLITDWDMPGMDGIELCQRIREENFPHYIYTVLLTAHHKVSDIIQALEAGADDLLTKPIAAPELLARLHAGARVIELENQLVLLARTDPLTGVPNRWVFFEHFERELARSRRHNSPLCCVLCDIDFFKAVNDNHGHIVGDIILKAFAQVLLAQCRATDHLCRYGGEEFCILLTDTDEAAGVLWAERIRALLSEMALPSHGKRLSVTASFGVAALSETVGKPSELLDMADNALRIAKHTGRNRVTTYQDVREIDAQDLTVLEGFRARLEQTFAREIMSTPVACLNQDRSTSDAAALLMQTRGTSVPITNDCGELVGIVSEKDLLAIAARSESWRAPLHDMMRTSIVSYEEETPALVIYDFLCRVTTCCVVIVKNGMPTGLVSRATLVRWLAKWQNEFEASRARVPMSPSPPVYMPLREPAPDDILLAAGETECGLP